MTKKKATFAKITNLVDKTRSEGRDDAPCITPARRGRRTGHGAGEPALVAADGVREGEREGDGQA